MPVNVQVLQAAPVKPERTLLTLLVKHGLCNNVSCTPTAMSRRRFQCLMTGVRNTYAVWHNLAAQGVDILTWP